MYNSACFVDSSIEKIPWNVVDMNKQDFADIKQET